jgi:biopolymer transport protein ExbD
MLGRLAQGRRRPVADEAIHIVALWNLMIILIPFLLLSAVFSQTSILNLYLPPPPPPGATKTPPGASTPKPVVSIVRDGYLVSDGPTVVAAIPLDADGRYQTRKLTDLLLQVKTNIPDRLDIVILSEATIPYETIVHTMDASREAVVEQEGRREAVPLFPNISLGQIGRAAPAAPIDVGDRE